VAEFGGGGNHLPVTAMACATAGMKIAPRMTKEQFAINKTNRELAYAHMEKLGVTCIPSVSNFFMISVKGMTGAQVGQAMATKKIVLAGANRWPEWPQHIRVTVGTFEEMTKFNAALTQVVNAGPKKA
jgi:histidinol-phosphate aminotransferase